jgi:hypothetical protein
MAAYRNRTGKTVRFFSSKHVGTWSRSFASPSGHTLDMTPTIWNVRSSMRSTAHTRPQVFPIKFIFLSG